MARGINKVILIGNLGNTPEMRKTTTGSTVTNVSLATSETWKDKQTGQTTEKTEWHRVIFFNRVAEIVAQYCQKGSKIYVEGRIQTRKWTDKDGQERYSTEIIANELQLLDSRQGGHADVTNPEWPRNPSPEPAPPTGINQETLHYPDSASSSFEDDDIPF